MRKKIDVLTVLFFSLTLLFSGCGRQNDASDYVRAVLDERLQGEFAEAADIMGTSEYEVRTDYEESVRQFVYAYFTAGYEELNDYTLYEYETRIKEIFSVMKYEVQKGKRSGDKEVEVAVVIRPVDLFLNYTEMLQEAAKEIEESARNGGYEGSETEIQELMQYDYLSRAIDLLEDAYLKMQYSEPETVLVTVVEEEGHTYSIDEEEYQSLLEAFFRMDEIGMAG